MPKMVVVKPLAPLSLADRPSPHSGDVPWWRHQMETFFALLAICGGNSPVPGEFPTQCPVTRSFDVYFDLHPNKRLSKQSWGWWFKTPSSPLWRHCNAKRGSQIKRLICPLQSYYSLNCSNLIRSLGISILRDMDLELFDHSKIWKPLR